MSECLVPPLCAARAGLPPSLRASEASRLEFLSVLRFLLGPRAALLDRAAEIVDKRRVRCRDARAALRRLCVCVCVIVTVLMKGRLGGAVERICHECLSGLWQVVRMAHTPTGRVCFLVSPASHRSETYVCTLLPVPTCTCHDFVHTVARGSHDLLYVSVYLWMCSVLCERVCVCVVGG